MSKYPRSRWENRYGVYEGPRPAVLKDFLGVDDLDWMNIDEILTAMDLEELLVFGTRGRSGLPLRLPSV